MSAQHTPGPWGFCYLDLPLSEIPAYVEKCIAVSGGERFYFITGTNDAGEQVDVCHVGNGPRGGWNGMLIAAAPDLLEALRVLLDRANRSNVDPFALQLATAAIVKATGSTT